MCINIYVYSTVLQWYIHNHNSSVHFPYIVCIFHSFPLIIPANVWDSSLIKFTLDLSLNTVWSTVVGLMPLLIMSIYCLVIMDVNGETQWCNSMEQLYGCKILDNAWNQVIWLHRDLKMNISGPDPITTDIWDVMRAWLSPVILHCHFHLRRDSEGGRGLLQWHTVPLYILL